MPLSAMEVYGMINALLKTQEPGYYGRSADIKKIKEHYATAYRDPPDHRDKGEREKIEICEIAKAMTKQSLSGMTISAYWEYASRYQANLAILNEYHGRTRWKNRGGG